MKWNGSHLPCTRHRGSTQRARAQRPHLQGLPSLTGWWPHCRHQVIPFSDTLSAVHVEPCCRLRSPLRRPQPPCAGVPAWFPCPCKRYVFHLAFSKLLELGAVAPQRRRHAGGVLRAAL